MSKKLIALLMATLMLLSLAAACGRAYKQSAGGKARIGK